MPTRSCEPNACSKVRASLVWRELNRGRVGVILTIIVPLSFCCWFQRVGFLWQIMNEREASVVPFYVFLASGQEVEGWPCSNAAKRHSGHPKAQIL